MAAANCWVTLMPTPVLNSCVWLDNLGGCLTGAATSLLTHSEMHFKRTIITHRQTLCGGSSPVRKMRSGSSWAAVSSIRCRRAGLVSQL